MIYLLHNINSKIKKIKIKSLSGGIILLFKSHFSFKSISLHLNEYILPLNVQKFIIN